MTLGLGCGVAKCLWLRRLRSRRRVNGECIERFCFIWGCSSVDRMPRLHRGGLGFESPQLHQASGGFDARIAQLVRASAECFGAVDIHTPP